MAPVPVLDLSTIVDPIHVRIDDVLYTLRRPEALSLEHLVQFDALRAAFADLQQTPPATLAPNQLAVLNDVIVHMVSIVLEAPVEVLARLSDAQRLAVVQAFTQLPASHRSKPGARRRASRSPTGATSSRASRGSTVVHRLTG